MDGLPHWYLHVAAPFISAPLAHLFNLSLSFSYVPPQWRVGVITAVPKVPTPSSCSDFRPITVTPILSRILEKVVVRSFLYPVLIHKDTQHLFMDQFASMEKFSNFPIPDNVYNWVVNFLSDRCHHTRFNGILTAIAFNFHFRKHCAGFGSRSLLLCYGGLGPTTPESH